MGLDMLLQILWALKGLSAEITLVWLERDVDANVGGYVITLDGSGAAAAPLASQVQIVCALSAHMALAHMLLERTALVTLVSLCRARDATVFIMV
jgi:hypothetical protein